MKEFLMPESPLFSHATIEASTCSSMDSLTASTRQFGPSDAEINNESTTQSGGSTSEQKGSQGKFLEECDDGDDSILKQVKVTAELTEENLEAFEKQLADKVLR